MLPPLLVLLVPNVAWPEATRDPAQISLMAYGERDYYAWLSELLRGPIAWSDGQDDDGRAYRIAHLESETDDTVLVEEVSLGEEACCIKLERVRKLDLDKLMKVFGLSGGRSGFMFLRWGSSVSFHFRFREREFLASGLQSADTTIRETSVDAGTKTQASTCSRRGEQQ